MFTLFLILFECFAGSCLFMTGGVSVLKFIEATVANFDKLPDLLEQSIKKAKEDKGDIAKDEFKPV